MGDNHLMINLFVEFLSILNAMYGEDPTVSFVQRAKDFGVTGGLRPRDTAGGLAVSRWTVAKGVRDLGMRSYVRRYPCYPHTCLQSGVSYRSQGFENNVWEVPSADWLILLLPTAQGGWWNIPKHYLQNLATDRPCIKLLKRVLPGLKCF